MRIAIIGKNSYIGNSFVHYLGENDKTAVVEEIEAQNGEWEKSDFSKFDSVVHVAAIVHRKDIDSYNLYKVVNVNLAYEVALRAKAAGVRHFVFFSSMAIYGKSKTLQGTYIGNDEKLTPRTFYGISKLEAEETLKSLEDDGFKIAYIRPSSVYGSGCRGNLLDSYIYIANLLSMIPTRKNEAKQGMVHIDNLCNATASIIYHHSCGVFHLQDKDTLSISQILNVIRRISGKKAMCSLFLGYLSGLVSWMKPYKKLYGGIAYSDEIVREFSFNGNEWITAEEGIQRSLDGYVQK